MSITRSVAAAETPPSVEQVRQQAKRRLIGVAVLVMAAVIVFPLLFDTQPRPVPVDMPIEIPSRKVAKPLQVDSPAVPENAAAEPAASPVLQTGPVDGKVASGGTSGAKVPVEPEEVIIASTPARKPAVTDPKPTVASAAAVAHPGPKEASSAEPAEKKPVQVPAKPAAEKAVSTAPVPSNAPPPASPAPRKPAESDAARAQALLEGKPVPPAHALASAETGSTRFIVQVGAFADPTVAQATREKLERAGLKTYTHVAQLPEGKRTRVRLGPFATKTDAEKAAAKAKAQGLPAAILTL